MSAYGGYTKPAYGAQGAEDSGGFVYGGSQQGSQGGGRSNQDESLRPVTIKQIIDAEEPYPGADFRIDGVNITQITFVGQVRAINPQPTNITYRIDDGTGIIEVKKWADSDKKDDEVADGSGRIELDQYVRVWGRLKSFNSKRNVGAYFLRPVTDFNEVNYHLLESTYVHLYTTRGPIGGGAKAPGGAGGGEDGIFVDGGQAAYNAGAGAGGAGGAGGAAAGGGQPSKLNGCGPLAQRMYNFLLNAPGGNEGVHLNVVASSASMSVRDVLSAADELLSQGLVYTTIDDETWAILDY
ncbi:replication protein A, subunit RPA32 [Sodiomyces alkalinus F11]|uniref:Replication protein A, subunit RPA32 n=1 Tax=Sodiomyces alkalinus (strain CBS 110278 / VKM F-3762 / F11) TaxID=1314773 RepID=A0A3N2Q4X0_SODAK|nr:replication protein A, subunit RPA32 [Sodiomyces alkalinus F11]ROT41823.1 replication protein A, subunit RPA32 [Sodiomyces alkalinus F11]